MDEVILKLKKYKPILYSKYGVKKIGVFGSVARGDAKEESDIDIVVEINILNPFILLDLKDELKKILNRDIDLVRMRKHLNPALKQRIRKEVIYV